MSLLAPVLLPLFGCASTPPVANSTPDVRVVAGSGTDDTRSVIKSSDEKMYNSEHAMSPDAPVVSGNQDVP